jgi:hypothetical protein
VSRHGSRIYAAYQHRHRAAGAGAGADADAAAVAAYQSDQAALRARLAAAIGATDRQVEDAAALVAVTDALSLAACGGRGGSVSRYSVSVPITVSPAG